MDCTKKGGPEVLEEWLVTLLNISFDREVVPMD